MALELIEIKDFPRTTSVTGSGEELIVVSKADGKTYGIKTSDFKAFLGTVTSIAPRPLSPTDPAPTLDGVYKPTVDGTYANAGGLIRDTSTGGVDEGMAVEFIKDGDVWVKNGYPLPKLDVVDNLTTADTEKALSSNQGVVLNDKIEKEKAVNIFSPRDISEITLPTALNGFYSGSVQDRGQWIDGGRYTKKIEVTEDIFTILVSSRVLGSTTALVFYFDENDNYISLEERGTEVLATYDLYEINIPENAKYIAISGMTADEIKAYTVVNKPTANYILDNIHKLKKAGDVDLDGVELKAVRYIGADNTDEYIARVSGANLLLESSDIYYVDVIDLRGLSGKQVVIDTFITGSARVVITNLLGNNSENFTETNPVIANKQPYRIPEQAATLYLCSRRTYKASVRLYDEVIDKEKSPQTFIESNFITTTQNADLVPVNRRFYDAKNNYLVDLRGSKGVLHVSMKYKFTKDINTGAQRDIPMFKLTNPITGEFLNGVVYTKETSLMSQKEKPDLIIEESVYPTPKFNSGFGWRTNVANVPEHFKNYNFQPRNLPFLKPICGKDSFSIWYKGYLKGVDYEDASKSVDDVVHQNDLASKNWKITIDSFKLRLHDGGTIIDYTYAQYPTVRDLYDAIESDTTTGGVLQDFETDYFSIGTGSGKDGMLLPSNSLVKCTDIPLINRFPRTTNFSNTTMHYDAFPFYAAFERDESIHTFEVLLDVNKGKALMSFDGQYERFYEPDGMPFNGSPSLFFAQQMLTDSCILEIGNSEYIEPVELVVNKGSYKDVSANTEYGIIASKTHPFILGIGGHGLFKGKELPARSFATGYDDETVTAENPYPIIPAHMRPPAGYKGDDVVPVPLSNPSGNHERYLKHLIANNFKPISLLDLSDFLEGKKDLPPKCFFVQYDDARTYIYADLYLRSLFLKHGVKPSFTCGESSYVDFEPWVSLYGDTVEHRKMLMKRLDHMKSEGWMCTLHGEDENVYQGLNSKETYRAIQASVRMGEYLNLHSDQYTWAASKHTLNAVKAFEHNGIRMALRSSGSFPSRSNPMQCVSRGYLEDARLVTLRAMLEF